MTETTRRDFLRISALSGAGAILLGRIPAFAANRSLPGAIGDITSLALVDDTLHLAAVARDLAPTLRESLVFGINVFEPHSGNAAVGGRLMPARPEDIARLAERAKNGWSGEDRDRHALSLALATGWLVYRAGADVIAPSLSASSDPAHAAAYQDAAILRARSAHLDGSASRDDVESLFRQTVPRTLVRFHTLIPDYDDAEGWIVRLQEWRAEHADVLRRYADAFVDAESAEYGRLVRDTNFYDADDVLLRLADRVRRTADATDVDLNAAVQGSNESLYGQALSRGLRDVLALSAFLKGDVDARGFEANIARA